MLVTGRFIPSAVDNSGTGYVVIPTNVNGKWWFYVCGTINGSIAAITNKSITISFAYYDM